MAIVERGYVPIDIFYLAKRANGRNVNTVVTMTDEIDARELSRPGDFVPIERLYLGNDGMSRRVRTFGAQE